MFGFGFGWVLKGRIRPEKRELHEQPYTDIEKSGTTYVDSPLLCLLDLGD